MTSLRDAAQQALEALEEYQVKGAPFLTCDAAVDALRAALAEPVQEPVTLPFGIEERAGVYVLFSKDGSCRPATAEEWMMWCALVAHGVGGEA